MDARERNLLIKMLDERHLLLMGELAQINKHLEELNSRTRKSEVNISILRWAYGLGSAVLGWLVLHKSGSS